MTPDHHSVTAWLAAAKAGDSRAVQKLWERYYRTLVRRARQALAGRPRRVADEEDVAAEAFAQFCRGAAAGRFPRLADRRDLWQVLLLLTRRRAIDHARRARARAAVEAGESALLDPQAVAAGPSPQLAAEVADEVRARLAALPPGLRDVVRLKLANHTHVEIAAALDCSVRTVDRKLDQVRALWGAAR
jgi:RNA polymerase sigma factor (sigma-70 family)